MLSKLLSTLLAIVSVSATGEPYCYKIDGRLIAKNLHGYKCAHYTSDYSNGIQIENDMFETVYNVGGVPRIELYTDNLMILPGNELCCPPNSFVEEITCTVFPEERGDCCRTNTEVRVTGLPEPHAECVHDVVNYDSHPVTNGDVSIVMPLSELNQNYEVEIYGGVHPNGCCACFLYSLECPKCEEPEEKCQSCLTDADCPNSPTFFGETGSGSLPSPEEESLCGSYCNKGSCSNLPEAPQVCVDNPDWTCGNSITKCNNQVGINQCICDKTVENEDFCWKDSYCNQLQTCTSSTECPAGTACASTCCGAGHCLPGCPDPNQ